MRLRQRLLVVLLPAFSSPTANAAPPAEQASSAISTIPAIPAKNLPAAVCSQLAGDPASPASTLPAPTSPFGARTGARHVP